MECPKCKGQLNINEKLSKGMGNPILLDCPKCGAMVLASGEIIIQTWQIKKPMPVL